MLREVFYRDTVTRHSCRSGPPPRKAAHLLKTKFGAKEVILFGSLARRGSFTLYSDIDLAAEGIHSDDYLAAMDAVLYLDPEFKIDLIDPEFVSPVMRVEIEKDGKSL
jgi:predicted nucleotidyltransferase